MGWREFLQRTCGPGILGGITSEDWRKLLRENNTRIAPRRYLRACSISQYAKQNSRLARRELERFGAAIDATPVLPPLFVLGHWRSGTTHLHQLLAQDERFAFPTIYECIFPHTFLTTEARGTRQLAPFLPRRRPMDNIEWTLSSPQEDEFALLNLCQMSPCLGWAFHERRDFYDRYLTFHHVGDAERAAWQAALLHFLKKVTLQHRRPLILKSPPHTARIRMLLELFPQAKFVHIHRDPVAVFVSSKQTFLTNFDLAVLGRPQIGDIDDWIIRQYRALHAAFFADRALIPPGNYCEVAFEALERAPLEEMRRVYAELALPEFSVVEPRLQAYVATLEGYRKNSFPPLPPDLAARLRDEWRECFAEWGYA